MVISDISICMFRKPVYQEIMELRASKHRFREVRKRSIFSQNHHIYVSKVPISINNGAKDF